VDFLDTDPPSPCPVFVTLPVAFSWHIRVAAMAPAANNDAAPFARIAVENRCPEYRASVFSFPMSDPSDAKKNPGGFRPGF
jgi:hypothetical protein